MDIVIDAAMVIFLLIMVYQSIKLMTLPYVTAQTSVVLNLPIPLLYASAPLGSLLSIFRIIQHYKKNQKNQQPCVEVTEN